jgi:hypothetical protein
MNVSIFCKILSNFEIVVLLASRELRSLHCGTDANHHHHYYYCIVSVYMKFVFCVNMNWNARYSSTYNCQH